MQSILGVWQYALQCLVVYAILGIGWYFIDRVYGIRLYRWCYDVCHKEPMPKDVVRGLLYNQSNARKTKIAFLVSTAQSIYMLYHYDVNLLTEIILWLLEVPAMLLGFWLGYPFYLLFQERDTVYRVLDEVEAKASTLDPKVARKEILEKSEEALVAGRGFVRSKARSLLDFLVRFWRTNIFSVARNETRKEPPVVEASAQEVLVSTKDNLPASPEPKETPDEIIWKFTQGKRK